MTLAPRTMHFIFASLIASIAFAASAQAAGVYGGGIPKCARPWSEFQSFEKTPDPYKVCFAHPTASDSSCFESARLVRDSNTVWTALRREQMKLLISQEVSYASRFKALSYNGVDHWAKLKERWRKRLTEDEQVLAFDRSETLGRDRCALSMVVGVDCGSQPGFDILGVHQARAIEAESNRAASKTYPDGISYDLLSAVLLLETLPSKGKISDEAKELNRETINSVLGFLPELAVDDSLRARVKSVARRQGLLITVKKTDFTKLDMQQRLDKLDEILSELVARPLSPKQIALIEDGFFKANELLLAILDSQIKQGRKDRDSIFEQDYLLYSFARHENERGNGRSAGMLQASICGNEIVAKRTAQRIELTKLALTAVGLVTGIGAIFDVGLVLSAVFVTTMSSSMIAVSAIDIYQTSTTASQDRDLFALKAVPYADWKESEDRFSESIPWAVVNVAATAPIFAIAKIHTAKRAAQAAGDLQRVKQLDRYQKASIAIAIGMGVPLTAIQIPPAYDAAKDLLNPSRAGKSGISQP